MMLTKHSLIVAKRQLEPLATLTLHLTTQTSSSSGMCIAGLVELGKQGDKLRVCLSKQWVLAFVLWVGV